jgi:hypothetical protein
VDKDNYLPELSRYVVLSPVRAKISKDPKEWEWSNYRATTGHKGAIVSWSREFYR